MPGSTISTHVTVGVTLTVDGIGSYPTFVSPLMVTGKGKIISSGNAGTIIGTIVNTATIAGGRYGAGINPSETAASYLRLAAGRWCPAGMS